MKVYYKIMREKDIDGTLMLFKQLKDEMAEVSFIDVESKSQLKKWLVDPNYYLYIAVTNKKVISVFRGIRGGGNEEHCILVTVATDLNYRSQGIAKNLILYSLKDIKAKQERIILARAYVYSDNKASLNTLLSCGFTISGSIYQHHYDKQKGTYIDDIILHKII